MKITKPDTTFTKGDYTDMQTNLDYEAIVTYLQTQSNRTDVVTVTFLEGMNLEDFGDTLEESGVCGKEEFLEKCNSTEFDEDYTFLSQITNSDERYYRLEGYLFPDTYDFYVDDNPVRVSRSMRDTAYKAMQVKEQLMAANGREPTVDEIAAKLGMKTADVVLALEAIVDPVSLYEPVYSDGGDTIYVMDQVGDANTDADWVDEMMIKDQIKQLDDRERNILYKRFMEGKTQMEVASEIGISQAQVSRLEKTALRRIKGK